MQSVKKILNWLYDAADAFSAVLLTVMFISFIIQIAFRYFLNWPVGWTVEVQTILWIWLVLWGQSMTVKDEDEIRFDIIYSSVPEPVARAFRIVFSLFLVGVYATALPAVWDYVTFMKVEETSYLDIRFDYVFSIFILFMVAVIIRYLWILYASIRGHNPRITPNKVPESMDR